MRIIIIFFKKNGSSIFIGKVKTQSVFRRYFDSKFTFVLMGSKRTKKSEL